MVKCNCKYHSLYHNERNLIMEQRILKAACYCRLSEDDLNDGTSISIETQITIAKQYCKTNRIEIVDFYCDDGYTGTNFERPAFKRMIGDIEKGRVDTVVVKDLSRFGRESIKVNYYTQMFFPENNINFIIIADNTVITANSTYDFMLTIKSAINEIYPAEVSQKVRQAFKAKSMNGEFLHPYLPYGYVKSTTERNHLVVDKKNADVVRDIFEMVAYKGMGMKKISDYLLENKILSPAALRDYSRGDYSDPNPYGWNKYSINNLLHNEVYLGRIIYGKRRKVNFKSQKIVTTDRDEWIVCENAHEAIISQELWDAAHQRLDGRRRERKTECVDNMYRSILVCADCGGTMWITSPPNKSTFFVCGNSRGRKAGVERCTTHNIRLDDLNEAVLADINSLLCDCCTDSESFRKKLMQKITENLPDVTQIRTELAELDRLIDRETKKFKRLYDDYYDGVIKSSVLFEQMSSECNSKIESYTAKKEKLESELKSSTKHFDDVSKFIGLMSRFTKIEVGERTVSSTNEYIQNVRIKYKFIGQLSRLMNKLLKLVGVKNCLGSQANFKAN